jgi:hypothetical protein
MKLRFLLAAVPALLPAAAADDGAPVWVAICTGDKDANYRQTEGGSGVFSQGVGDGSYVSYPLTQTVRIPDKIVCGATKGAAQFAQVCADNDRQVIFLKVRDPKNPKAPLRSIDYCNAVVRIH